MIFSWEAPDGGGSRPGLILSCRQCRPSCRNLCPSISSAALFRRWTSAFIGASATASARPRGSGRNWTKPSALCSIASCRWAELRFPWLAAGRRCNRVHSRFLRHGQRTHGIQRCKPGLTRADRPMRCRLACPKPEAWAMPWMDFSAAAN